MPYVTWRHYKVGKSPKRRGNHGRLYFGVDLENGRRVAIKQMANRGKARLEAGVMESYGDHPHLARFYAFFIKGKNGYIVMERISGERLGYARRAKRHSKKRAVQITISILLGLEGLHKAGYLHTDIAPQNILIGRDGDPRSVKVIDFASAVTKERDCRYRKGRKGGGTTGYMPGEQLQGRSLNDATDLFATACLCFCLLTGRAPKSRLSFAKISDAELRSVLRKAVHHSKGKRFASAAEFISALKPFA